jgi:hypothetical protein
MSARRPSTGRAARSGPGAWRWPALAVLLLALVAGVVVQRNRTDQAPMAGQVDVAGLLPVASGPAALSSTWYCAGGTATGTKDGAAEQTVHIANSGGQALTAQVTVMPSEGATAVRALTVPARGSVDLVLSTVVVAPSSAAVVEVAGGEVAVSHLLAGPTGKTVAACSSSPSSHWYLPAGTTKPGTRQLLAVFNPFPSEAVVGIGFETDDGTRTPGKWDGLVVPGQRVVLLDVTEVVTLRAQIATTVEARSGRVIVDQIQLSDGTNATVESLAVTPAAPASSPTWWFADGPTGGGVSTSISVQNPSDQTAEVQVQIRLDDAATNGEVEPFEVSVPAHHYGTVDVSGAGRVPQGIGYTAVARSTNGVPIVAARLVGAVAPATAIGTTFTLGSPVLAGRWMVPVGSTPVASSVFVVVTNPSPTEAVKVTVSTLTDGVSGPLATGDGVLIPAGGRGGFEIPAGVAGSPSSVVVESDRGVVVESRVVFSAGGLAEPLAVPLAPWAVVATYGLPDVTPAQAPGG